MATAIPRMKTHSRRFVCNRLAYIDLPSLPSESHVNWVDTCFIRRKSNLLNETGFLHKLIHCCSGKEVDGPLKLMLLSLPTDIHHHISLNYNKKYRMLISFLLYNAGGEGTLLPYAVWEYNWGFGGLRV